MTKQELKDLHLNRRVKYKYLSILPFKFFTIYGYVTKIYNGNWQVQVWFDGEEKPRVVGYSQIELVPNP